MTQRKSYSSSVEGRSRDRDGTVERQRKRLSFSNSDLDDPAQLDGLYHQCRAQVLDGTHPVSRETAIHLAAVQCYIEHGAYESGADVFVKAPNLLPKEYARAREHEKNIIQEYKDLVTVDEMAAKKKYCKLCTSLPTYGVTFFVVKERESPSEKRLVTRLFGVSKDCVMRVDRKSKTVIKSWPLEQLRRWAASPTTFNIDFGDYVDRYYSAQTLEGETIKKLIAEYVDIILKKSQIVDSHGIEGDEAGIMLEEHIPASRALPFMVEDGKLKWRQNTQTFGTIGGDLPLPTDSFEAFATAAPAADAPAVRQSDENAFVPISSAESSFDQLYSSPHIASYPGQGQGYGNVNTTITTQELTYTSDQPKNVSQSVQNVIHTANYDPQSKIDIDQYQLGRNIQSLEQNIQQIQQQKLQLEKIQQQHQQQLLLEQQQQQQQLEQQHHQQLHLQQQQQQQQELEQQQLHQQQLQLQLQQQHQQQQQQQEQQPILQVFQNKKSSVNNGLENSNEGFSWKHSSIRIANDIPSGESDYQRDLEFQRQAQIQIPQPQNVRNVPILAANVQNTVEKPSNGSNANVHEIYHQYKRETTVIPIRRPNFEGQIENESPHIPAQHFPSQTLGHDSVLTARTVHSSSNSTPNVTSQFNTTQLNTPQAQAQDYRSHINASSFVDGTQHNQASTPQTNTLISGQWLGMNGTSAPPPHSSDRPPLDLAQSPDAAIEANIRTAEEAVLWLTPESVVEILDLPEMVAAGPDAGAQLNWLIVVGTHAVSQHLGTFVVVIAQIIESTSPYSAAPKAGDLSLARAFGPAGAVLADLVACVRELSALLWRVSQPVATKLLHKTHKLCDVFRVFMEQSHSASGAKRAAILSAASLVGEATCALLSTTSRDSGEGGENVDDNAQAFYDILNERIQNIASSTANVVLQAKTFLAATAQRAKLFHCATQVAFTASELIALSRVLASVLGAHAASQRRVAESVQRVGGAINEMVVEAGAQFAQLASNSAPDASEQRKKYEQLLSTANFANNALHQFLTEIHKSTLKKPKT